MELNRDWRGLQKSFFPVRKGALDERRPIYLVADKGVAVTVYSEGEDLASWQGTRVDELRAQFNHRQLIEVDRARLDQWILSAMAEAHLPGQVDHLRQLWVETSQDALARHLPGRVHFLLEALQNSWWTRVLPTAFGILLRLEAAQGGEYRDFLLVYRKGRLEQFGEPDLSFMGAERRGDLGDVIGYLSERFSVPVQSVLMSAEDWERWSAGPHPWKEIAWAIQSKRVQLVPNRWQWVSLVATRGFIGI